MSGFAFSVGPARAATGTFPYEHRTVAELDAIELNRYHRAEAVMKGPNPSGWMDWASVPVALTDIPAPTTLPTAPCFRCGARRGCEHRAEAA